jgi:hypothetical protein
MREFIKNGTPRMPALRYYLGAAQIDANISYRRTVPVRPPPQPRLAVPAANESM